MNLREQAAAWIRGIWYQHVARNIRNVTWITYTGEIRHNSLGGVTYLNDATGTVVDRNDEFTLVKVGPAQFHAILTSLFDQAVGIGDKIAMTFYQPRRFDGTPADGSEDAADDDGVRSVTLTGTRTLFPVKWEGRHLCINERHADGYREIQNPYLRDLIRQMESMAIDGGLRHVVNLLVDAKATGLDFVDPPEGTEVRPAILANVATKKFEGRVCITYDRSMDLYDLTLTPDPVEGAAGPQGLIATNLLLEPGAWLDKLKAGAAAKAPTVLSGIGVDELGEALAEAIDDREWLKVKVAVLKRAPKQREEVHAG